MITKTRTMMSNSKRSHKIVKTDGVSSRNISQLMARIRVQSTSVR